MGGFAWQSANAGDTVTVKYSCQSAHNLYWGTALSTVGGAISASVDGGAAIPVSAYSTQSSGAPTAGRRLIASGVAAGSHTVVLTVASGTCIFDFLQAAVLSDPVAAGHVLLRGGVRLRLRHRADLSDRARAPAVDAQPGRPERRHRLLRRRLFRVEARAQRRQLSSGDGDALRDHQSGELVRGWRGHGVDDGRRHVPEQRNGDLRGDDEGRQSIGRRFARRHGDRRGGVSGRHALATLAQRIVNAINGTFVGICAAPTATAGQFTITVLSPINGFSLDLSVSAGAGIAVA